jgi:hypothetical protein
MAIAAGAVAGAAIVACVYETRGTQSRPSAAPSGLARNGAPGTDAPQQPAVTGDDAWRAANAGLVVRERAGTGNQARMSFAAWA